MNIVGILQNQWFGNPETARAMFDRHPDKRATLIRSTLSRSVTGRRLKEAFGDELFHTIVWENVSPGLGGHSGASFSADRGHLRAFLEREEPDIILAFGQTATNALRDMGVDLLLSGPHPASQLPDAMPRLRAMADIVRSRIEREVPDGD